MNQAKPYLIVFFSCLMFTVQAQFKSFWEPVYSPFDSLVIEMEKNLIKNENLTVNNSIIKSMFAIADSTQNPVLLSRAMQWEAYDKYYNNKDTQFPQRAITLIDTLVYPYDYARMKYLKGALNETIGNYAGAYRIWQEILPYFKDIEDNYFIANTLKRIGTIYFKVGEYEKALNFYKQAGEYYRKANLPQMVTKNKMSIANGLYHIGKKDEGLKILKSLLDDSVSKTDFLFKVDVLFSITALSLDFEDRQYYAKENYDLIKQLDNKYLMTRATINLGASLIDQKHFDEALPYLHKAKKLVDTSYDITASRLIHKNLSQIYESKQQWDSAYYYSNLFHAQNDSMLGARKIAEIKKTEARESIRLIEQEVKEVELKRKIISAILFGVCCLLVSVVLVTYFKIKKTRIQKKLKETKNKELNTRLKSELLLKENLQLEVDSKNRELSSNTLLISEKNRVLKSLSEQLKELEFKGFLSPQKEEHLQLQIEKHLKSANEWEYFKLHFENVHPNFFKKLKEHSSTLSENDLRICAYIRIGMDAKQIAQMLSVQPGTVNTSRYRIRKKLGIVGGTALEDFLRAL